VGRLALGAQEAHHQYRVLLQHTLAAVVVVLMVLVAVQEQVLEALVVEVLEDLLLSQVLQMERRVQQILEAVEALRRRVAHKEVAAPALLS
jgi:hypothetical protein